MPGKQPRAKSEFCRVPMIRSHNVFDILRHLDDESTTLKPPELDTTDASSDNESEVEEGVPFSESAYRKLQARYKKLEEKLADKNRKLKDAKEEASKDRSSHLNQLQKIRAMMKAPFELCPHLSDSEVLLRNFGFGELAFENFKIAATEAREKVNKEDTNPNTAAEGVRKEMGRIRVLVDILRKENAFLRR